MSDLTRDDIMRWQGEMFIYSCWLYENDYETVFSDQEFDGHCQCLIAWYDTLPFDMQERIPMDNLEAGTGLGIEYEPEDGEKAIHWFTRVRGRPPVNSRDI